METLIVQGFMDSPQGIATQSVEQFTRGPESLIFVKHLYQLVFIPSKNG